MFRFQVLITLVCSLFCHSFVAASDAVKEAASQGFVESSQIDYPFALQSQLEGARAWVLYNYESGELVGGANIDAHSEPASITKLMTNYVVFSKLKAGEIQLDDKVYISEKAWRMEGSRMFAEFGSRPTVEELLKSTTIQSGNDAAVALAEFVAGSEAEFATLMNQAAKKLGMSQSSFKNSTGLPADGHYMSAVDIAKLGSAIIREFPDYYDWYSIKEYRYNNITQQNRNRLLWRDPSVDGLKTGHTKAAGYCLVGSAVQDNQRWIAVVLGTKSEAIRADLVLRLLRQGFSQFESTSILDSQEGVATAQVFKGAVDEIKLKPKYPASVVVPSGRAQDIEYEFKISPYYEAPIGIGQSMGLATASVDGKVLAEVPLVAMSDIPEAGLFKLLGDTIRLKWQQVLN